MTIFEVESKFEIKRQRRALAFLFDMAVLRASLDCSMIFTAEALYPSRDDDKTSFIEIIQHVTITSSSRSVQVKICHRTQKVSLKSGIIG